MQFALQEDKKKCTNACDSSVFSICRKQTSFSDMRGSGLTGNTVASWNLARDAAQ